MSRASGAGAYSQGIAWPSPSPQLEGARPAAGTRRDAGDRWPWRPLWHRPSAPVGAGGRRWSRVGAHGRRERRARSRAGRGRGRSVAEAVRASGGSSRSAGLNDDEFALVAIFGRANTKHGTAYREGSTTALIRRRRPATCAADGSTGRSRGCRSGRFGGDADVPRWRTCSTVRRAINGEPIWRPVRSERAVEGSGPTARRDRRRPRLTLASAAVARDRVGRLAVADVEMVVVAGVYARSSDARG